MSTMYGYGYTTVLANRCATSKAPDGYWDGNDMKGQPCPQGAYVYIMRYRNSLNR